jgi:glucose/arabinose dehydrogenase
LSTRERIAALLAAALILGTMAAATLDLGRQPGAVAAGSRPPAPALSPPVADAGQRVRASGRLPSRVIRPVVLQRQTAAGAWRRVASARTDAQGRYHVRFTAPRATTRYRVKAPAVVHQGRDLRRLVTRAARLTVGGPTPTATPTPSPSHQPTAVPQVELSVASSAIAAGPAVHAEVRVTPATGGIATVQRRSGSDWIDAGVAVLSEAGSADVAVALDDLGTGPVELRAAVGSQVSTTRLIDVEPPGAVVAPTAEETLTGRFTADVQVDPALEPVAVRVFVDGIPVPEPAEHVGGAIWRVEEDPRDLGVARRHVDLVAQVGTADGRGLTRPVLVELQPAPGGLPPGFRSDTVVAGLDLPTSFAALDASRVLVAEKAGLVRLAVGGSLRTTPVLDLRSEVSDRVDAGLIDVALDPGFAENGWFYVAYVRDDDPQSRWETQRVERFTLDGDTAVPGSRHVVLGAPPLAVCAADEATPGCLLNRDGMHTVDDLVFLPDGSLLVSVGDGAAGDPGRALVAQRREVLAGKVLRVDADTGLGLPDNPFYEPADPASNSSRVYALGFRNPFRLALGPGGHLYAGDVGEGTWEEVDDVVPGGNYGWPCYEGTAPGTASAAAAECVALREGGTHRTPLLTYPHAAGMGSVTLGPVYDGGAYPSELQGRMFVGDYTMGRTWTVDPQADEPSLEGFGIPHALGAAVAYAMGPDDTIWYADVASGRIGRIVYDPGESTCRSGTFLQETFRNRLFEPEPGGAAWVSGCVGSIPSGPDLVAPGSPNQGDGWSMRWSGTPQLAPGTYELSAASSGHLEVRVDGVLVTDGGTFLVTGADLVGGTAQVEVRLTNNPAFDDVPYFVDFDWGYRLSWRRVGSAPSVSLEGPAPGGRVRPDDEVAWTVSASDAEDGVLPAADTRVLVEVLHYGTSSPHAHPSGSYVGPAGSTQVHDAHAPGRILYRLTALATDSSGRVGQSPPVYVCLVGNDVGPCS